jgi:hypothetical protein
VLLIRRALTLGFSIRELESLLRVRAMGRSINSICG